MMERWGVDPQAAAGEGGDAPPAAAREPSRPLTVSAGPADFAGRVAAAAGRM